MMISRFKEYFPGLVRKGWRYATSIFKPKPWTVQLYGDDGLIIAEWETTYRVKKDKSIFKPKKEVVYDFDIGMWNYAGERVVIGKSLITLPLTYAKEKLLEVKSLGFDAVIAGGYVRDKLLGKTPKDIDIFVVNSSEEAHKSFNSKFPQDRVTIYLEQEYCQGSMREEVVGLTKSFSEDYIFVNKDIRGTMENFDTSLCQAYLSLDEEDNLQVYVSEDFAEFGVSGKIYRYEDIPTTQQHLERVSAKFDIPVTDFIEKKSHKPNMIHLGTPEDLGWR